MFKRSLGDTPDALNQELIAARVEYNNTIQSVVTRASERRDVIGQTVTDLKAEDERLAAVVEEARKS